MKTSTIFSLALVALTQFSNASAAVEPTRVLARAPQGEFELDPNKKGQPRPSEFPMPDQVKSQGCFSSGGNFTKVKNPEYVSSGSCGKLCFEEEYLTMALQGGQCFCGTHYPPENTRVKDKECNFPCPGFDIEACGSLGKPGHWSVFNTGNDVNAEYLEDEDDEDEKDDDKDKDNASKTSTTSSSAIVTQTSSIETAPASQPTESGDADEGQDEEKSGPNTAGIIAGVVVGVAVIAGGIGGFFFWMRRRRNAEIEEDHRRNAAVNAFINGSKPPSSHGSISMTDSRLDPVMAHRRMSDGSIADNQDYSRRILRVTNA